MKKSEKRTASELYSNTIKLSIHVRTELMKAIKAGIAPPEAFGEIRKIDDNIKTLQDFCKQEGIKLK